MPKDETRVDGAAEAGGTITPQEVVARKERIAELSEAFPYTRQPKVTLVVLSSTTNRESLPCWRVSGERAPMN